MRSRNVFFHYYLRTAVFVAILFVGTGALSACALLNQKPPQALPTLVATANALDVTVIAVEPTRTATATQLPPTFTPIPTIYQSPTPGPSPTPSDTPTPSPTPTETPSPTPSPTSRPQVVPSLSNIGPEEGAELTATPPTPIPSPVPTFALPASITNVLLLGNDSSDTQSGISRTDSMIIVSINRELKTASMVSIPRDLYVYIPGWQMNRINTAVGAGARAAYPGGGIARLKDAILYNLGIPIHYYAQVDFNGFKGVVDAIGGVDIAVSCQLTDWRLKSPELDINVEENYERFTLAPGIHHMDGDTALWYARSRVTTSDFDRGRRQQQLLRALLNRGVDLNLLPQIPELWSTYQNNVTTDMDIGRILQLASIAPDIRTNGVKHLYLAGGNVIPWAVPDTGAHVQLPNWEVMQGTLQHLFLPPALSFSARPPIFVEIVNASGNPDLALLAAENLRWHGFVPILSEEVPPPGSETTISYYADNFKGSFDWLIAWIFGQRTSMIQLVSDAQYMYDYRVTLGSNYNPCRPEIYAPLPNLGE